MTNILNEYASEAARKVAEQRELQVNRWVAKHGFIKLLFGRWLITFADMKGFKMQPVEVKFRDKP